MFYHRLYDTYRLNGGNLNFEILDKQQDIEVTILKNNTYFKTYNYFPCNSKMKLPPLTHMLQS